MAHIAILMCTYNGESHIQAQLDSIAKQNHRDWSLHVSDDGSTDNTLEIVREFSRNHPQNQIQIYNGPKKGFSNNFQSLMLRPQIVADFYALADQDDVWLSEKLKFGISLMTNDQPILYGSRTTITDNDLNVIGMSPLFTKPASFQNALVQSIMGGNTMILNNSAMELVRKAGHVNVISHDWWLYLLVSGAGGEVIYDPHSHIFYRQHESNLVGSNKGIGAKYDRIKRLFKSEFSAWNSQNVQALQNTRDLLSDNSKYQLDQFSNLRLQFGFKAILQLHRLGIYRQLNSDQIALYLTAFLKKL